MKYPESFSQKGCCFLEMLNFQRIVKVHTKQKCNKKMFFQFHAPFDRELQDVQEYVCLDLFLPFFRIEKLQKLGRCEKHMICHRFSKFFFLKTCYEVESSNLVFLIQITRKPNKKSGFKLIFGTKHLTHKSNFPRLHDSKTRTWFCKSITDFY